MFKKKTINKVVTTAVAIASLTALCTGCGKITEAQAPEIITAQPTESPLDYYKIANQMDLVEMYNSPDLTPDILTRRNGKIIVEICIGRCLDAETGAGVTIGDEGYYISYSNVYGVQDGDIICTYMLYNPENNYEDDIISRYDYVIDNIG